MAKQENRCYLCGDPFGLGMLGPTYDHVIPRALGGGKSDILLSHLHCNSLKGDRPPTACEVLYLTFVRQDLMGENQIW